MSWVTNTLLQPTTVELIEAAVAAHVGRSWQMSSWTDMDERSSHPAIIMRDESRAVFAKLAAPEEARSHINSELAGLRLIADSGVKTPAPIGSGRVDLADGSVVLLLEALKERTHRSTEDWQNIGRALAILHNVKGESYGAATDGFSDLFGWRTHRFIRTRGLSSMPSGGCIPICGPPAMPAR